MSRKTLAHAVRSWQMLTFTLSPEWEIRGWLCGLDDYHYKVVDLSGNIHLIHKTQAIVTINESEGALMSEDLRVIVAPFRSALEQQQNR
jgi:hypothetical protein